MNHDGKRCTDSSRMNLVESSHRIQLACRPGQTDCLCVNMPARGMSQDMHRVLIIDDNADLLCMIEDLVSMLGHEVQAAPDAMAGVRLARTFRPSVILCDIGLPDMAGYEVARILRSERNLESIRMVSMSGYGEREHIEKSREAGFDRHLVKPVSFNTLCELLNEAEAPNDGDETA